mgnify:CR=1 FL=1
MSKKTIFSIILITIAATGFVNYRTTVAAACGEFQVFKDGKIVKTSTSANGPQVTIPQGSKSKYKLVIKVPRSCPGTYAEIILDHPNGSMVILPPQVIPETSGITKEVSLDTSSPEGTYQYRVHTYKESGNWQDDKNDYFRVILGKATPDPGPGGKQPGGENPGDTGTGTVNLPAEIDSAVDIKSETDFDEVLGTLFNPLNYDRPENILVRIINIMLMLAGILAVLFIIIGGFLMVTSTGNETRLRQGKQTLIWAVAGLILTLLSFSIVAIVQSILS